MKVCILGSGLSALTLAKALVNQKINVDIVTTDKKNKFNQSRTIGISKSNLTLSGPSLQQEWPEHKNTFLAQNW